MATTREQFIALRKSGMTPVQAREEVMKTVTPVSTNANVAQLEANKAKVQAEIQAGTRPEVGTSVTPQAGQTQAPTPVLPTAPTTTPSGATLSADGTVTPATPVTPTTPTPTPETPKVETPAPTTPVTSTAVTPVLDKNAEIKAKNEAKLAENQQKAKLAEEQRQKGITEQNTALANNEGAILASLKTGGMIPESVKTSPFYKSAQQTYNKLQQYSTYSTNELVTAMNQGSIVPGTNVYNEMMKDPAMKQKLTDAQVYRAGNPVNSTQIYENASSEIMSNNPTTANYLADGVITQEEYDQATNNTQVVAKAKEVEEKANKYNTLKAEYDSIEDEVNAQFPGSPFADSIIADRQKAKYKNLVLAKGEWETATGTLTELKSQASTLFETNLNLAEKIREEQNTIAAEQRAVQRSKDALQYESDFNKKQAEAALNDPATAIPQLIAQYQKMGIPITRSTQEIIQDFESSGQDLGTYLTGLQKLIQEKPEYQQMLDKQKGEGISYETIGDSVYRKNADGTLTKTNISPNKAPEAKAPEWKQDASGNWYNANSAYSPAIQTGGVTGDIRYLADQFPNQAWAKNNNPAGITWNSNFDKGLGTAKLLTDAGISFTKGTARPANEGGNYVTFATIEDGLKAQQIMMTQTYGNSTVGQMLSSWVGTKEGPNYAKQVAGMAGVDTNAKVSSLTPEQISTLQMAKIQKESPGLAKLLKGGSQAGTQGASSDAQNWFNLIQKGTTSYEDVMKKLGGTKVGQAVLQEINGLISSKGGAIPALPDSEPVKKMDDLIGRLDTLLANEGNKLEAVSGMSYGSLWDKTLGYSKEQALGNLKFVLKGNTLQQLIDAKAQGATFGALSNEELRMLQESASPILAFAEEDENKNIKGFKVDEATFKQEIQKLRDLFKEKREKMVNPGINKNIVPNQSVPVQTNTNTGVTNTGGGQTTDSLGIR